MKRLINKTKHYLLLFFAAIVVMTSCNKDDDFQDPNPPNTNVDVNKVTQGLKFRNSKIISGSIPKSAQTKNGTIADLKISVDTIFWVEGIKNRLRILKPKGFGSLITHFWAQVEGADDYIEAEFEIEKETDTLAFFEFDFDLGDLEPPFSFNIKFAPSDDTGTTPIDIIDKPVVIEKRGDFCELVDQATWLWNSTYEDGEFLYGPGEVIYTDSGVTGCCFTDPNGGGQTSLYGGQCPSTNPPPNIDVISFPYQSEFALFEVLIKYSKPSNIIFGEQQDYSNNLDIANTDFCSNDVTMIGENTFVGFGADVVQNGCTFTLENFSSSGNSSSFSTIYIGSGPFTTYEIWSKHIIREKRIDPEFPDSTGGLERFYITKYDGERWYD